VKLGIEKQVGSEPVRAFGRAPGFAEHAIDIGPNHRCRVIEGEERIKPPTLELPLSSNAAALPFDGVMDVGTLVPGRLDPGRILGVLVRKDPNTGSEPFLEAREEAHGCGGPVVLAGSVLPEGEFHQGALRGHGTDVQSQNLSSFGRDHEGNTQGQALGAFKAFHLVKLEGMKALSGERLQVPGVSFLRLLGCPEELSNNGLSIGQKNLGRSPLRDA